MVILFISSNAFMKSIQSDPIVGTWINTNDSNVKLVFANDNKEKVYYNGELLSTYTYDVTRDPVQCGVDMSERLQENPGESILVETNTQTNEKNCELVYNLTQEYLSLSSFGHSEISLFKKQD